MWPGLLSASDKDVEMVFVGAYVPVESISTGVRSVVCVVAKGLKLHRGASINYITRELQIYYHHFTPSSIHLVAQVAS